MFEPFKNSFSSHDKFIVTQHATSADNKINKSPLSQIKLVLIFWQSVVDRTANKMSQKVLYVAQDLSVVSKFSGFTLFTITESFQSRITNIDIAAMALTFMMFFGQHWNYWSAVLEMTFYSSEVVKLSFPIIIFVFHFGCVFASVWCFIQRHNFALIAKAFAEIDDAMLQKLHLTFNYQKQRKSVLKFLIISVSTGVGFSLCSYISQKFYGLHMCWKIFMFVMMGFYYEVILANHFVMMASGIKLRFRKLNELIK